MRISDWSSDVCSSDLIEAHGGGAFPVCIAKTQYSFSTDPDAKGAPTGHVLPVREVRLSNGAEFVVVICGEIMTMPGLPRVPAANRIGLNAHGQDEGLVSPAGEKRRNGLPPGGGPGRRPHPPQAR